MLKKNDFFVHDKSMTSWPGKGFSAFGIFEKTAEGWYYLACSSVADMCKEYIIFFTCSFCREEFLKKNSNIFFIFLKIQYSFQYMPMCALHRILIWPFDLKSSSSICLIFAILWTPRSTCKYPPSIFYFLILVLQHVYCSPCAILCTWFSGP